MKSIFVLALVALPSIAFAESTTEQLEQARQASEARHAQVAAQATQPPATFTITVTPQELMQIGAALGKQPYEAVAFLIDKIRSQTQAQAQSQVKPQP